MASSKLPTPGRITAEAAAMSAGSDEAKALPPTALTERTTLWRLPFW